MTTRTKAQEIMDHLIGVVFDSTSTTPVARALDYNGYVAPEDFLMEKDETLDALTYDDSGTFVQITKQGAGLLKTFKQFVAYHNTQGQPYEDKDWVTITRAEFNKSRSSNAGITMPIAAPTVQQSTVRPSPVVDLVRDFKRGIKRDASQFPTLKDDAAWDNWNRSTMAQARAQDIVEVLDPVYIPATTDEAALFLEKQKFVYAVFEKTLLTDKGKALVRKHQNTFDAQKIYDELSEYAKKSTKATMDAASLLSYITTTNLADGKWRGTTHAFILHWQDQVRKYHDLAPQQTLNVDIQCTLLQNAVHPITELRAVKLQAEQFRTQSGKVLSYEEYCSLLLSAAQQYDMQRAVRPDKIQKQQIFEHDVLPDPDPDEFYDAGTYDIDQPIDTFHVNESRFQGPRLSYDQWHALPEDAQKIWDTLSQDAKGIILRPPPKPDPNRKPKPFQQPPPRQQNVPFPRRSIHEHDIDYIIAHLHELHGGDTPPNADNGADTSVHVDAMESDEQPLLAHMTKKKHLPPGNVKRLLSPTPSNTTSAGKPQEVNPNGTIYRQVNTASTLYSISSCHASGHKGSLVDRGANGGIAGDDVRIIAKTDRSVDIQGIDNHRINEIPLSQLEMSLQPRKDQ